MVTSHLAFSQFVHLRPNQEVPELVELVFNDGTTKRGNVKNNKMDRILLRILSQDPSAFRHASIEVDYIRFKPEGETEFQRIPTNEIKHVLILEDEVKRYDRINVYRINKRKLKIKDKEPALMIQTPTIDDALVVYTNFYFNYGNGGGVVFMINIMFL